MSNTLIVNGVRIETNKDIARISGARVDFTDGSYCDVSTGTVVSKERGYISMIGAGSSSEEMYYFNPVTFNEKSLSLSDLPCSVVITGSDEPGIVLSMYGPKNIAEKIRWRTERGALVIDTNEHYSFPLLDASKTPDLPNNPPASSSDEAILRILVPKSAAVFASTSSYPVQINGMEGDVNARVNGSTRVVIGSMKSGTLWLRGSGSIIVAKANGNIDANITGSGTITVDGGVVSDLTVQLTGSGKLVCIPDVSTAKLELTGSGKITAKNITTLVRSQKTGSGTIDTGN